MTFPKLPPRTAFLALIVAMLAILTLTLAAQRWFSAPPSTAQQEDSFRRMQLLGVLRADWLKAGGSLTETEARQAAHGDSAIHLLFLGVDRRKNERGRSDAIHILRLEAGQLTLFSVPRDSLIKLHSDSRPDKINHCYAYGGHAMILRKLEDLLDIRIDGYLEVDLQTFVRVAQFAKTVTLNGRLVGAEDIFSRIDGLLSWLRNRSLPGGDIHRVARQQLFIARSLDWTLSLYRNHPRILESAVVSILKILPTDITVDQVMVLCQIYADDTMQRALANHSDSRPVWPKAENFSIARMERYILPGTPILVDIHNGAVLPDTALSRTRLHAAGDSSIFSAPGRFDETSVIGPSSPPRIAGPHLPVTESLSPGESFPQLMADEEDTGVLSVYRLGEENRLKVLIMKWRTQNSRMNYDYRDELLR